ncbi:MAG: hypothetical protein HY721_06870 [Planctomycetes bacterium]|nr:hypothetical protein [Planctomycetota bacterium]
MGIATYMAAVQGIVPYTLYFLLVSFVVAFSTSMIRERDPRKIGAETIRFFVTVVLCILAFAVVVAILEWLFIRPLV